jgi:hypothetical protein
VGAVERERDGRVHRPGPRADDPGHVRQVDRPLHRLQRSRLDLRRSVRAPGGAVRRAEPLGPWTTVDYEENFDNTGCGSNCLANGEAVGWSMMQKWFSSDGLTIWPEYNSTDLSATALYDSLNLIKGTISLATGSTIKNLDRHAGRRREAV